MSAIKLSVPDWCYFPKLGEPDRYYETLRTLGIQGVEMVDPSRYAAARAMGLEILNVSGPGKTKGLNHREHHADLIPQIRDAIEHAHTHEIPLVIVFSGNRHGQSDKEGWENCRRGIEELIPVAQSARVMLGFEMFNIFDHPGYQADHGRFGFELVTAVGSPWLRLVYDIYHMERMGDDSLADTVANLPLVAHLHVAESPRRNRPRADGKIRYDRIVPAVMRAGYRGYWGFEFIPEADPLADLKESIALFNRLAEKHL